MSLKPNRSSGQQHRFHPSRATTFEPPPEFSQHAHIKNLAEYERLYKESIDDPDKFWSRIAGELHCSRSGTKLSNGIVRGPSGLSEDRSTSLQLPRPPRPDRTQRQAAIIWESEPGEIRKLTYADLHREVQKFATP